MIDDCPTTRRYPRTLWQAFPDERAHCIEVGHRPWWWRLVRITHRIRSLFA